MPDQPGENEDRGDSNETSPRTIREAKRKDYVDGIDGPGRGREQRATRVNLLEVLRWEPHTR